jgi:hypothetical protein
MSAKIGLADHQQHDDEHHEETSGHEPGPLERAAPAGGGVVCHGSSLLR